MPVRGFSRTQAYLLPPSLDDWLPGDHPVRYVAEFVDALEPADWQEMGIDLEGAETGAPAYHPRVLISVWLAGFMSGIRSSRKLEGACRDQVSFRWLTGNQVPDHNTLWRFYHGHRQGMRHLLRMTVRTALTAGLVDLVLLAVDGTKVAGNAGPHRNRDAVTLRAMEQRLSAAIAQLEAEHDGGDDDDPPRLPRELKQAQHLRERVRAALEVVQAEHGPRQANLTDPETRIQKTH
jgi:transposase